MLTFAWHSTLYQHFITCIQMTDDVEEMASLETFYLMGLAPCLLLLMLTKRVIFIIES